MSTTYTVTLSDQVWVGCKCEKCGKAYQYAAQITGKGVYYSKTRAENQALNDLNKKLKSLKTLSPRSYRCLRHIQPQKCPQCNTLQRWMKMYRRSRLTTWLNSGVIITAICLLLVVEAINSNPINILLTVLLAGATCLLGTGFIWTIYDPLDNNQINLPQIALPSRAQHL